MGLPSGIQALRRWHRALGPEVVRIVLSAELAGTNGDDVATWRRETVRLEGAEDGDDSDIIGFGDKRWCDHAYDVACADTEGRDQTTRYRVGAYYEGDEAPREKTYLQILAKKNTSEQNEVKLDGSTASVIQQLQRTADSANKHMFDMVKLLQASATQNNALIAQLSNALREKEDTIAKLVDLRVSDKIEMATKIEQAAAVHATSSETNIIDDEFKNLWKMAAPYLAKELVQTATSKVGPLLELVVSVMSGPEAAEVSTTPAPASAIASTVASSAAAIVDTTNVQ